MMTRLNKITLGIALALGLTACVAPATGVDTDRANLRFACTSYATILVVLASNKDSLPDEAKRTILDLNEIVSPVCLNLDTVTNYNEALDRVQDALFKLQIEKAKYLNE